MVGGGAFVVVGGTLVFVLWVIIKLALFVH